MEDLMNESENQNEEKAFEKMLAESKIDDISMQRTVVGGGYKLLKGLSQSSGIDSIKEVKHLYTAEETNINKISSKIKAVYKEIQENNFENEGKNLLEISIEKNPEKCEKSIENFLKKKQGFEAFSTTIVELKKIQEEARNDLMDFLASAEADQELEELESNSQSRIIETNGVTPKNENTQFLEEIVKKSKKLSRRPSKFADGEEKQDNAEKAKNLFLNNKGGIKGQRLATQTTRFETYRSNPTENNEE